MLRILLNLGNADIHDTTLFLVFKLYNYTLKVIVCTNYTLKVIVCTRTTEQEFVILAEGTSVIVG